MGSHAQARHLFHLEIDIAIDQVVREQVASQQELAVRVQSVQSFIE